MSSQGRRCSFDQQQGPGKRPRASLPISSFDINDSDYRGCQTCERDDPIDDCINHDFSPKVYFSLALILEDASCESLLKNTDDYTLRLLINHAVQLAIDSSRASYVVACLSCLQSKFRNEGITKLIPKVQQQTELHCLRELKFIYDCLQNAKSITYDRIQSQNRYLMVDLGSIVMCDIRYARLLPLLSIILPKGNDEMMQSQLSREAILDTATTGGESAVIELSDTSFIDMTQESFHPHILPAPSQVSDPDDSEDVLPLIDEDELSFDREQHDQDSPADDLQLPDYKELTTPELKAKLGAFGFKTNKSRVKLIQDLEQLYGYNTNSSQTSSVSFETEIAENSQYGSLDINVRDKIIVHLRKQPELWSRIVSYETVSVEECIVGLDCKKSEVKMVLDEYAAAEGKHKRLIDNK